MKYTGRIWITCVAVIIIFFWHSFYFLQDYHAAYSFFIENGFIIYFIFPPLLFPLFWWLGKQYDLLRYVSEKDVLTQVYNRRYVMEKFPQLIYGTDRRGDTLCLLVIDIDKFKSINDRYGHVAGDQVLQSVALILQKTFRKFDIIARWGGDEFIVLAPSLYKEDIVDIISNIESELDQIQISTNNSGITLSIGVSEYPAEGDTLDGLIHVADQAMYRCKLEQNTKIGYG